MIRVDDLDWYACGNGEYCEYCGDEYRYTYRNGKYLLFFIRDDCGIESVMQGVSTDYDAKQFIVDLIDSDNGLIDGGE